MPKYGCRAAYFADDKDLSDIFEQGRFTVDKLREYARSRGIFLSDRLEKSDYVHYLRKILCDWHQVTDLVALLDTQDRSPHLVPERRTGKFSDQDILEAVETIKAEHKKLGLDVAEAISVTKTADNEYRLECTYSENHWNKTRLLQNEPKIATIIITRESELLRFKVEDSPKARQIFNMLPLVPKDGSTSETKSIDLSEVKTPKQRTALFVEMIQRIYAHNLHDVTSVNVEFMKATEESGDPTDEEISEAKKEEIKSNLKSAALSGSGLLRDRRYQELVNSDYFLCKVAWTVDHDSGRSDRIALSAEFTEPENGKGFRFSVIGKWERDLDGQLRKTRKRLTADELKMMQNRVEQAAFDAYEVVSSPDFGLDDESQEGEPV